MIYSLVSWKTRVFEYDVCGGIHKYSTWPPIRVKFFIYQTHILPQIDKARHEIQYACIYLRLSTAHYRRGRLSTLYRFNYFGNYNKCSVICSRLTTTKTYTPRINSLGRTMRNLTLPLYVIVKYSSS